MNTLDFVRTEHASFGFNDYLRHLPAVERSSPDARPLRVAVLRSYTAEPLEPILKLRLLLDGLNPTFWFGGYNQHAQEILDPNSALYAFAPQVVLLLLRIDEILPAFVDDFASLSPAEWEKQLTSLAGSLEGLLERLEESVRAPILVQNLMLAGRSFFGRFDAQQPDGQVYLLQQFNRALSAACSRRRGAFVWDFDALVREKGSESLYDAKQWYVSRNPFRQAAYPAIAGDLMRYLRAVLGPARKCVVLDLDNTLWGGVAGEDGLEGVKLGRTYPGNCYRDFQTELLKLYHRGVILAINSKNNEADAFRIIDDHPDMVLRRRHFAAVRVNWRDKATNLRELASELDIGVDSLIFLDDSPIECELVRQECPECHVVQLPAKPYLLPAIPSALPGLDNLKLTAEDRKKGEMYRTRAARRADEGRHADLDAFLRSLELEVEIQPARAFTIPRIAQLTQKTNQMNMTTRRYTEAQISALAGDEACEVLSVASRDRFGDDGIVGAAILRFDGDECRIDTFLLSCRVIGRGIEQAMLADIAHRAAARNVRTLVGEFIQTAKNRPAAGLYERAGLRKTTGTRFTADLTAVSLPYPVHIRPFATEIR